MLDLYFCFRFDSDQEISVCSGRFGFGLIRNRVHRWNSNLGILDGSGYIGVSVSLFGSGYLMKILVEFGSIYFDGIWIRLVWFDTDPVI